MMEILWVIRIAFKHWFIFCGCFVFVVAFRVPSKLRQRDTTHPNGVCSGIHDRNLPSSRQRERWILLERLAMTLTTAEHTDDRAQGRMTLVQLREPELSMWERSWRVALMLRC